MRWQALNIMNMRAKIGTLNNGFTYTTVNLTTSHFGGRGAFVTLSPFSTVLIRIPNLRCKC